MAIKRDKYLVFANRNQALLYEVEMSGQISDGNWENSSPHDHWKCMCDAIVCYSPDESKQGTWNFIPKRKYNFANGELLKVVGDRARRSVILYNLFPKLRVEEHHDYSVLTETDEKDIDGYAMGRSIDAYVELAKKDSYYKKKLKKVMSDLGVTKTEQLKTIEEKINSFPYSSSQMKKDLVQMSKIVAHGEYKEGKPTGVKILK